MENNLKKIIIYIAMVALTVFVICCCLEIYYIKEELLTTRVHNEQMLELRVRAIEEMLR
jgi:hypothetical protein